MELLQLVFVMVMVPFKAVGLMLLYLAIYIAFPMACALGAVWLVGLIINRFK